MRGRAGMRVSRLVIGLVLLLGVVLAGFWVYVEVQTYPADPEWLERISEDPRLTLDSTRGHYALRPESKEEASPVMVFYPGGLVDPAAYLYIMGQVALGLGLDVYVVRPPFNAAIFRIRAAGSIIEKYPDRKIWVGGHSLGGIAACRYAAGAADRVDGLFLFGSYCDRDLDHFNGWIISIMGDADQVINRENYDKARKRLPEQAVVYDVAGLNHSAFGEYGHQRGDGPSQLETTDVLSLLISAFDEVR